MLVSGATVVATFSLPSLAVKSSFVPASPLPGLLALDEQAPNSAISMMTDRRRARRTSRPECPRRPSGRLGPPLIDRLGILV